MAIDLKKRKRIKKKNTHKLIIEILSRTRRKSNKNVFFCLNLFHNIIFCSLSHLKRAALSHQLLILFVVWLLVIMVLKCRHDIISKQVYCWCCFTGMVCANRRLSTSSRSLSHLITNSSAINNSEQRNNVITFKRNEYVSTVATDMQTRLKCKSTTIAATHSNK